MLDPLHGIRSSFQRAGAGKKNAYRLGELGHIRPVGEHVGAIGLTVGLGSHLLDIRTSSEGLLGTGNDNRTDVVVSVKLLTGINNLNNQIVAEGIESLGSVEGDNTDVALDLSKDELVGAVTVETLLVSENLVEGTGCDKRALHFTAE